MRKAETFSDLLRKKRMEKGFGLREFARIIKMQPSNYCSIEAGSLTPPSGKLDIIASALGIGKGSQEYYHFIDLASKVKDEIPPDIKNLVMTNSLIPAMLRTIENHEVGPKQLKKIIEDIRSGRYRKKTSN